MPPRPHQTVCGFLTVALGLCGCTAAGSDRGGADWPPLAGQTSEPESGATTDTLRRSIINGTPDLNPAHRAVVALTWGSGPANYCSGTLISPDVVLTAAHCLKTISPDLLEVFFGNDVNGPGDRREVAELAYHPLWDEDNLDHGYDLGLVRLSSPAPADATPIPFLPAALALTATDESTPLEHVGFGRTEDGTSGQKLTVTTPLGRVCDGPGPCSFAMGSVAPGAFGYSMDTGGPCSGDSGGPALIWRGGQQYVAGVTSYGDELCQYFGVSTRPDSHSAWIDAFLAGVAEDCGGPGDEDSDTLADCADPDCDDDPACGPRSCLAAEEIGCGDEIIGTTEGGSHQLRQYSCSQDGLELGPERAYVITAPRGLFVYVTLHPDEGADLDLFLLPWFFDDCAEWDCLDGSSGGGDASKQISFRARTDHGLVVVDGPGPPGGYTLVMACDTSAEDCTNSIDDDADGATDCEDADCAEHPSCAPPPEECTGGVDEDKDGLVDCDDPDCSESILCKPKPRAGCQQSPAAEGGLVWLLLFVTLLLWRKGARRSSHPPRR